MYPTLPLARIGYTLHVITTAPRTHVARLVRPDGAVVSEWTKTCAQWWLRSNVARLREHVEESLGSKATLPVYYAICPAASALPAPQASPITTGHAVLP